MDLSEWLPAGHDLYVVGVQECLDVAQLRYAVRSTLVADKVGAPPPLDVTTSANSSASGPDHKQRPGPEPETEGPPQPSAAEGLPPPPAVPLPPPIIGAEDVALAGVGGPMTPTPTPHSPGPEEHGSTSTPSATPSARHHRHHMHMHSHPTAEDADRKFRPVAPRLGLARWRACARAWRTCARAFHPAAPRHPSPSFTRRCRDRYESAL